MTRPDDIIMVNNASSEAVDSSVQNTTQNPLKRKFHYLTSLLMPRKRSKPNPSQSADDDKATTSSQDAALSSKPTTTTSNTSGHSTLRKQRSWYDTWPLIYKSAPSMQVARESIMAAKSGNISSADLSKFEPIRAERSAPTNSRPPSMYLGKSKETSGLTMSDETLDVNKIMNGGNVTSALTDNQGSSLSTTTGIEEDAAQRPATSSGFLSYIPIVGAWAAPKQPAASTSQPVLENSSNDVNSTDKALVSLGSSGETVPNRSEGSSSWIWPFASSYTGATPIETSAGEPPTDSTEEPAAAVSIDSDPNMPKGAAYSRQWFSGFSLSGAEAESKDSNPALNSAEKSSKTTDIPTEDTSKLMNASQPAPSSWGRFFSSSKKSYESETQGGNGELTANRDHSLTKAVTTEAAQKSRSKSALIPKTPTDTISTPQQLWLTSSQHLLMPELPETYKLMEDPSILQQLARLVRLSREPPAEHVSLLKEPRKINTAVAIGVHGLFPHRLVASLVGVPTGTSKLFMSHAQASIHRYTRSKGYRCKIYPVALEYEGQVATRVENLWKQLLSHISEIQNADFVMFACHSQGVPVSVILAAKLVELGVLNPKSMRIGICAMAGVNLGPIEVYKNRTTSTVFGNATGFELFDLANSESVLSKIYIEALRKLLRFEARVTYIGSIDDQLVSMESSTFTPVQHPYIYRAVFVDSRLHRPDFITRLVGFALKLRNMGVKDHGLIRELSHALRGPLLSGQGHSVIYDDPKVYDLAIQHALETTSIGDVDLKVHPYNTNMEHDAFFLPFAIRGVLDEDLVKTELFDEAREMLKEYDEWIPTGELVKVKLRLRAIRSMVW